MKVSANFKYLGLEKSEPSSEKKWCRIGLLQGLDSEKIYINQELVNKVQEIKPMSDVVVDLRISIGEKTYVNLDDIQVLK